MIMIVSFQNISAKKKKKKIVYKIIILSNLIFFAFVDIYIYNVIPLEKNPIFSFCYYLLIHK